MGLNDRVLGLGALALAAFLAWQGIGLEAPFSYEPVGPRAFPMLLAAIIGLCGLWLLVRGGHPVAPNPPGANLRIVVMIALVAAYALLFQTLGFIVATALMTACVGRLFGGSWLKTAIGGVIMSVALFLLFDTALDVVLPVGVLGGVL